MASKDKKDKKEETSKASEEKKGVLPSLERMLAAATDMVKTMLLSATAINDEDEPTKLREEWGSDEELAEALREVAGSEVVGTENLAKKQKADASIEGPDVLWADTKAVLAELGCDPGVCVRQPKEEKAPKEEKKGKAAKASKAGKTPEKKEGDGKRGGFKPGAGAEKRKFMASLIEKGKFSKKDIMDKTAEKFPEATASSLATMISDGKNPKYNKFDKLIIENKEGQLSFAK